MTDNRGTNDRANQSNCYESYGDYLKRAITACEAGDLVLGMHLYLAAYERAVADPDIPDGMAIAGLREAWNLACNLKERSMAEYVFEKLEPFLTGEEIAICANKLQSLALDRLEEYGFSREELQGMAEMISQDFMDGEASIVKVESIALPGIPANLVAEITGAGEHEAADEPGEDVSERVEGEDASAFEPEDEFGRAVEEATAQEPAPEQSEDVHGGPVPTTKGKGRPGHVGLESAATDFNPYDQYKTSSVGKSYHAATNEGAGLYTFTRDKDRETELERARAAAESHDAPTAAEGREGALPPGDERDSDGSPAQAAPPAQAASPEASVQGEPTALASAPAAQPVAGTGKQRGVAVPPAAPTKPARQSQPEASSAPNIPATGTHALTYKGLAGYGTAISAVRELGVGLQRDAGFRNFVKMMNARHGLSRMPALDTLLFRAPVIEDAARFVDATIGEIGLPVLRMSMEEGFQGAPVLCVTAFGDNRPRMNHAHNRFDGPGILVIDDLDMWSFPQPPENVDGFAGLVMANMSRGAREAMNMIRAAVEDPDVFVLVTATHDGEVDPFFYDLLEPISVIDIDYPTEAERDEIWHEIMRDHPSMRPLDRGALVRLSAGMPRYDLYMAARSAIEEAYKAGLVQRMYLPVTLQNVLDKLAAYLPLDSDEYRAVEDEAVRSFQSELDELEKLLDEDARP